MLFQPIYPSILRLALLTYCFSFFACQSGGQNNNDESDYSQRRKIPSYVMEELPSQTDTLLISDHSLFLGHGKINPTVLNSFTSHVDGLIGIASDFLNLKKQAGKLVWHVYPSSEIKGLMLKNSAPIHIDFEKKEIHSVVNSVFKNHYATQGLSLYFRNFSGEPKTLELEAGLAIRCDKNWQNKGHEYWAQKLIFADAMPSLSELLTHQNRQNCSPLIYGTASALLVDFLIEKNGRSDFLKLYPTWEMNKKEWDNLENEWDDFLKKAAIEKYAQTNNQNDLLPYLKGFNFAHEGYRVYNGYGSRKATQALSHLKNMGVNSIAMVPYSYMRNAKVASHIPVVQQTGTENDESIITSSEEAQDLGMTIVMKPQIWLGGGQWPGDIEMKSEVEWEDFFHCYRHWIFHYAILAEIYNWEALCIGTEMVQTTLKRKSDWEKLIQDIRKIYSGQLTYAANWGEEFENVKIWGDLDFIGINCYYPLSQKENPSRRELEKSFKEILNKIEKVSQRYGKQIVFTEIGFPSIEAPWKKPHEDWGDFETNERHQAQCYDIVFESIQNKKWCNGILWWKYPCDLEHRPRRNTGFTPHGKHAEATVEKWFNQNGE